jgi:hypothetical protein
MEKTKQDILKELEEKELDLLIKEKQNNISNLETKLKGLNEEIVEKEKVKEDITKEIKKEENKVLTESEETKKEVKTDEIMDFLKGDIN